MSISQWQNQKYIKTLDIENTLRLSPTYTPSHCNVLTKAISIPVLTQMCYKCKNLYDQKKIFRKNSQHVWEKSYSFSLTLRNWVCGSINWRYDTCGLYIFRIYFIQGLHITHCRYRFVYNLMFISNYSLLWKCSQCVRLECGMLGVPILATTDLIHKNMQQQLHCQMLCNRCQCHRR